MWGRTDADKRQRIRICEAAFLILLGYINSRNASSANLMWQSYKKLYFDPTKTMADLRNAVTYKHGKRKSRKWINAEVFFRLMMEVYGDAMPTAEGVSTTGGKLRKILPYESKKSLYREYLWQCQINKTHPTEIAKATLCAKVFKSLKDEIRLLGCKGKRIKTYFHKIKLLRNN